MFLFLEGGTARLGNTTTLSVEILSNDYPNGLFDILNQTQIILAEDHNPGEEETTQRNVSIRRIFGGFYAAKVGRILNLYLFHLVGPIVNKSLIKRGLQSCS